MAAKPRHLRYINRQENLQRLIEEAGSQATFCALTGTEKTHVSALVHGRRNVGDELAQRYEAEFGKPPGWMDLEHGREQTTDDGAPLLLPFPQLMDHATPERRRAFYDLIRLTILQARDKYPSARISATLDYIDKRERQSEGPENGELGEKR